LLIEVHRRLALLGTRRLELLLVLLEMLLRAPRVTTPPPRMPRSVPAVATGVFFFGAGCFNI
jgi:hypothetical protein